MGYKRNPQNCLVCAFSSFFFSFHSMSYPKYDPPYPCEFINDKKFPLAYCYVAPRLMAMYSTKSIASLTTLTSLVTGDQTQSNVLKLLYSIHPDKFRVFNISDSSWTTSSNEPVDNMELLELKSSSPPLNRVWALIESVSAYLESSKDGIACIFCKDFKEKLGLAVSCVMMCINRSLSPTAFLQTEIGSKVESICQQRTVSYAHDLSSNAHLASQVNSPPIHKLKRILMFPVPPIRGKQFKPSLEIYNGIRSAYATPDKAAVFTSGDDAVAALEFPLVEVQGDVSIAINHSNPIALMKDKLFLIYWNTLMVDPTEKYIDFTPSDVEICSREGQLFDVKIRILFE